MEQAPSVRRGYVPAEQGITSADFLLFTITGGCNIAGGGDWGLSEPSFCILMTVLNPPMEADGASPIRTAGVCARGAGHYFRRCSMPCDTGEEST